MFLCCLDPSARFFVLAQPRGERMWVRCQIESQETSYAYDLLTGELTSTTTTQTQTLLNAINY